jgi:hypothetical protein
VLAGALHFVIPRQYEAIMPPSLPAPRALVYASGVAEIAGGVGVMHPRTRRLASLWSIATLVAVFPANVHMALHPERYPVPGGRDACGDGGHDVDRGPARLARVGLEHDLDREGGERREAAEEADAEALADVAVEPVLGDEEPQQERAEDVDPDR